MCTDCNAQPDLNQPGLSRRGFLGRARRLISAPPLPNPVEQAPGLEIYPRSAWAGSDREPTGELYPESVYFLIVHHSATTNDYDEADVVTQIQDMFDNDTGDKGWPDVTYNFFIDRFGRIFEGRAGSLKGPVLNDQVGGNQGWAQQVCLLGEFSTDQPSAEALDSLTKVMAWLADRHKLEVGPNKTTTQESRGSDKFPKGEKFTVNTIAGHRDVADTECPGDVFYPYVKDQLPQLVADYRSSAANPSTTTPETGSTSPTGTTDPTSTPGSGPTTSGAPGPATTAGPSGTLEPDESSPESVTTVPTATTANPTSPSAPTTTTEPVTVGSAGSSAVGPLLSGMGSGIGVVAIATGIGWVIQRRRANGL